MPIWCLILAKCWAGGRLGARLRGERVCRMFWDKFMGLPLRTIAYLYFSTCCS